MREATAINPEPSFSGERVATVKELCCLSPEAETQDKAGSEGVQLPGGALWACNCVHLSDAPYFNLHKGCIWTSSGSGSKAGTAGLCPGSAPPLWLLYIVAIPYTTEKWLFHSQKPAEPGGSQMQLYEGMFQMNEEKHL